jgi:NHL repeat
MRTKGCLAVLVVISICLGVSASQASANTAFERAFGDGVTGSVGFGNCTATPGCVTGTQSGDAGAMHQPSGAVFDTHGGLLISDYTNHRVDRYLVAADGSVTFDRTFGYGVQGGQPDAFQNCTANCEAGTPSSAAGSIQGPWKAAVDAEGRILVPDDTNRRVSRFLMAPDGTVTFDRAFGWDVNPGGPAGLEACTTTCQAGQSASYAAGSFEAPDGVAVDSSGGILVGEFFANRISRFTVAADGTPTFDRAFGLDVIPGGSTDFENCTTATTCKDGLTLAQSDAAGLTAQNYSIEVGPDGRYFVSDYTTNRVDVFSRAGNGTISFDEAFGADVIPGGGTGFETCTTATTCKVGLENGTAGSVGAATGVAVAPNGDLYVIAEHDNRFSHFIPGPGGTFTFDYAFGDGVAGGTGPESCTTSCVQGSQGPDAGELNAPQGAVLGSEGRLYVTDYDNNRISVFGVGPTVTVKKTLSPVTDPGRFDLKVGPKVVKTAAGNDDSGSTRVAYGGAVTVSEVATDTANPLSNYDSSIDCGAGPTVGSSLALQNVTTDLTCTVTNTRKVVPPPAKVTTFSKVVLQPKSKKVKAGKKVKLTVKVTNTGNTSGTATVKLSSSSKKKATVPKTVKVTVGAGKTVSKKFTVKTKKKKTGKVTIKATVGKKSAKTTLKLKK